MKVSKTLIICLSIFFVIITSSMVFAGNTMVDESDDSGNISSLDDNETDDSENITDDIVPIDDNETDDSGNITSVKDNLRTDNNRNEDGQLSYLNKHHTGNLIILALLALSAFCFVSKRK